MKALRLGLLLLLIHLVAGLAAPSLAQQSSPLAELIVRLWPDFDRPEVLVILQGTLDESVELPAIVSLPLPPGVEEPYVVATAETDAPLTEVPSYEIQPGEDANWVTFETESPNVWLEYYDAFENDDDQRDYTYHWPGGIDVAEASFEVLQPLGVDSLDVTPEADPQLEDDGQVHYVGDLGELTPTDQFEIQFNYLRTQAIPSLLESSDIDQLAAMNVRLWPEFDQQAMLVILEIFLPEDVDLPARVVVPLPARVPEPHAVAYVTPEGELFNAVYELSPQGQWMLLAVDAETRELRVEYYDILAIDGQERSYRYDWPGGIDIAQLGFEVLPPAGAQNVRIAPEAEQGTAASGQPVYSQVMGPTSAQETLTIDVAYEGELVAFERPEGVTGGTPDVNQWLPWVIGGVALLLVGGGGWMLLRDRKPTPKRKKRRRRSASEQKEPDSGMDAAVVFCHVCGARSIASDRFCRQCGSELRT
jgi:hypothetical protein